MPCRSKSIKTGSVALQIWQDKNGGNDPYFWAYYFWTLKVSILLGDASSGQQPWAFMGNYIGYYEIHESIDIHKEVDLLIAKEWIRTILAEPTGGGYCKQYLPLPRAAVCMACCAAGKAVAA